MYQSFAELVTFELIPLVRAALKETAELIGAVQVLSQRVEELTTELAAGLAGLPRAQGVARRVGGGARVVMLLLGGGAIAVQRGARLGPGPAEEPNLPEKSPLANINQPAKAFPGSLRSP